MKSLRKLLWPFALLYGCIAAVRNYLYSNGALKVYRPNIPVVVVGNLSTGGTGKTPHTEYLIRLLQDTYGTAVLSRGYKRKSQGFVLAAEDSNVGQLGDEPFQYHTKFRRLSVAVDADRANGITELINRVHPQVIVLDDAYQHRRVKAGFYILLTAYDDLYTDDMVLPAGNLREFKSGAKRAHVIIVTKCPSGLNEAEQEKIRRKIKPRPEQQLYFTAIGYDTKVYSESSSQPVDEMLQQPKILVAGIAKPEPFFRYLQRDGDVLRRFPDHHDFTQKEVEELTIESTSRLIVTTEKDYMRLKGKIAAERLFYLPITVQFLDGGNAFNNTILNYVGTSTANR